MIGSKSRKSNWNWRFGLRREFFNLFASAQMSRVKGRCQQLTNVFGAWNWQSHYDDEPTISHNDGNLSISSLPASSPFSISRVVTHIWQERARSRERKGVRLPLEIERLTFDIWHFSAVVLVWYSMNQFMLGIPRKTCNYLAHWFHRRNWC